MEKDTVKELESGNIVVGPAKIVAVKASNKSDEPLHLYLLKWLPAPVFNVTGRSTETLWEKTIYPHTYEGEPLSFTLAEDQIVALVTSPHVNAAPFAGAFEASIAWEK